MRPRLRPREEPLDSVIGRVGNIDAAGGCHREVLWVAELTDAVALCAPFVNEHACGGELLDAAVANVCNVDAVVGCHRNATQVVELTVVVALCAPFANKHTISGGLLDAVVVGVCNFIFGLTFCRQSLGGGSLGGCYLEVVFYRYLLAFACISFVRHGRNTIRAAAAQ